MPTLLLDAAWRGAVRLRRPGVLLLFAQAAAHKGVAVWAGAAQNKRMSNYAWVCFTCCAAVRRPGTAKDVRCPSCAKACECLGARIAIPPKSKPERWAELRQSFYVARAARLLALEKWRTQRVHQLEQEIARLEALPDNPGRAQAVSKLKNKLDKERA